jgi:hypothetical protein
MTISHKFEHDVFISYSHIDNQALTEGQKGWIDQFHYALERRLNQLLGNESKLWRDPKLCGNDYFDDVITNKFSCTALLVSVLSPRYVRSDWCVKELQEFCRTAQETGGARIEDKARLFKVIKTPLPREEHPNELQGLLGYEFYTQDAKTGRMREFIIDPKHELFAQFQLKLDDLAYDIREMLCFIRPELTGPRLSGPMAGIGPLYLAETTSDLQHQRDQIRREFKPRGTCVLPDRSLPLRADLFKSAVQSALEQSKLAVHLIGQNYGVIPEGEARSIVCLQNDIAASVARTRSLARIIWLPPDVQPQDERQARFIDQLRNDITNDIGVELVQASLQELKILVHDKLQHTEAKILECAQRQGPISVYLIYDQCDIDRVQSLTEYLFRQGYEVLPSLFEGDGTQLLEYHKDSLISADSAVIYYGSGNEFWVHTKLRDLQKAYGYGRTKQWTAKAVYIVGPPTPAKERFNTNQALRLKNFAEFTPESIEPFLNELKKSA